MAYALLDVAPKSIQKLKINICNRRENYKQKDKLFGDSPPDASGNLAAAFETCPSIGLGVGHGATNFLQLNLAFAFSPAQQITTAVSKLETRVYVIKHFVNFKFIPSAGCFRMKCRLLSLKWMMAIAALTGIQAGGAADALAQRALIAVDGVKVYALPMEDIQPSDTLAKGDTVRVIGQRGEWVKIAFHDGQKGWMKLHVEKSAAANGNSQTSSNSKSSAPEASNGFHKKLTNGHSEEQPDSLRKPPEQPRSRNKTHSRFGYSFGLGVIELEFTYNWKFVFHSSQRLALEGSFRHALGDAADSYFIAANVSYLLKEKGKLRPYLTGGAGAIKTAPARSVGSDGASNIAVNVGVGARRLLKENLSLVVNVNHYTAFVGNGVANYREFSAGILVGRFWK